MTVFFNNPMLPLTQSLPSLTTRGQSYVICEPTAAAVIKTYSPNLMVSPLLRQSATLYPGEDPPDAGAITASVSDMLARLHVLVVGPGLGRDPLLQDTCKRVLAAARERRLPVVLDADVLQVVNADPGTVSGWREAVLTPNVVEFGRLARAVGVDAGGMSDAEGCRAVAEALGGACLVRKGREDYISDGSRTWTCGLSGSLKRSGGQGDTLTGCIGTFLCWRKAYMDRLWDVKGGFDAGELVMLAAWGGAAMTRECSRLAQLAKGRSMQASDVGEMVPKAFEDLIGEGEAHARTANL